MTYFDHRCPGALFSASIRSLRRALSARRGDLNGPTNVVAGADAVGTRA
jgi:hypothetical protein